MKKITVTDFKITDQRESKRLTYTVFQHLACSSTALVLCFRYILHLAIADSIFLLTLPFQVSSELNQIWIYPEWLCKAKETILFCNYYASILFLVVNTQR